MSTGLITSVLAKICQTPNTRTNPLILRTNDRFKSPSSGHSQVGRECGWPVPGSWTNPLGFDSFALCYGKTGDLALTKSAEVYEEPQRAVRRLSNPTAL